MVFYRRQDANTAIQKLSGSKDVNLASMGPEIGYSFKDTWTKSESTAASAVTPTVPTKGTRPIQEARRVFLASLPRMEDHKRLESLVREIFPKLKM